MRIVKGRPTPPVMSSTRSQSIAQAACARVCAAAATRSKATPDTVAEPSEAAQLQV
jgi:hypothetical protein